MQRQRRRHSNPTVASARNPFDGRCAISSSPKAAAFIVALTSNKAKRVQSWLAGLHARYVHCITTPRQLPFPEGSSLLVGPLHPVARTIHGRPHFFLQVLATPVRHAHLHNCTLVLCSFLARVSSSKSFFFSFHTILALHQRLRVGQSLLALLLSLFRRTVQRVNFCNDNSLLCYNYIPIFF